MCGRSSKCTLPEPTGSQDDRFEYHETVAGAQALAEGGSAPVRRRRRSDASSAPAVAAGGTLSLSAKPSPAAARRALSTSVIERHGSRWPAAELPGA